MDFEQLYDLYADKVFQYIYFLVGERRLAEDLTQETFMKAWRRLAQYKGDATYKTWLVAIARNTVYDYFRQKAPFSLLSFIREHEPVVEYTPESWLLENEAQHELYEGLGRLKYEYREAIVLTNIEGYSAEEAARILGWNTKKVHNAVERGMKRLSIELGGGLDA